MLHSDNNNKNNNKKTQLPVFSYTDVTSITPIVLPAQTMAPHLPLLLFLDTTITSLSYPKCQNLTHLSIPGLPCPPVKVQARAWSRSQQGDLVWCGSMKDNRAVYQEQTY